jgi:hypothetical protein
MDADRADEYRDCAERVAREVLGEPNHQLSNGKGLRWGNHGSMSLNAERGLFYDHERNEGGGVRWLLRDRLGLSEGEVDVWLEARCYVKPRPDGDGRRKIVAIYDYTDETGGILFQVVRFEPKEFRQRRPDSDGGWIWSTKGVRQVPYRLPALLEALANDRPIVLVEGEKDVDNLANWNVPATCNAGGAGKWRPELSEHFRGADVILTPDATTLGTITLRSSVQHLLASPSASASLCCQGSRRRETCRIGFRLAAKSSSSGSWSRPRRIG